MNAIPNKDSKTNFSPMPLLMGGKVLQRQCACGNHTAGGGECAECAKKKQTLQRKLAIGANNDPLEQEADRIAEQVMAAPSNPFVGAAPPRIQRLSNQPAALQEIAPPSVDRVLASPGRPLEPAVQRDMGQRFGYDFSHVRVHTGSDAEQSSREVNAHAYTVGHNVVFGAGRYAPGMQEGRRLIAHELAHVVQQNRPASQNLSALRLDDSSGYLETEARMAEQGVTAEFSHAARGIIYRKGKSGNTASGFCGGKWSCASGSDCEIADNAIIGPMPPSTWWKLTIMIDTEASTPDDVREDSFGHTYVKFSESNGNMFTYGFYPNPTTIPNIMRTNVYGCVVHPDTKHESCVDYKEDFNLTQPQHSKALTTAQSFCKAPPRYDLFSWNCTTFADLIAKQAEKTLPSIRGKVGKVVTADNPNTLLEGLKARDAGIKAGKTGP